MPTIQAVTDFLESVAPLALQESYDNAGLLVGNPQAEVTGVLCCLDSTEAILDEAETHGCNLIVAHHPIIFRGLKQLTGKNYVERVTIKAIRRGIAIYAIHTNLDNVLKDGVNERIAQRLGLEGVQILRPQAGSEGKTGAGAIGQLPQAMSEADFLAHLRDRMRAACVRHTPQLSRPVEKVAVCGGVGGFLLEDAVRAGAQVFVTSDYKYHEFFDADGRIMIADIGHFESEQFTADLLSELIQQNFRTFAVRRTEVSTNPIRYFIG